MAKDSKIEYQIHHNVEELDDQGRKRVVIMSWGSGKPTIDIRKFSPEGVFGGISLSLDNALKLQEALPKGIELLGELVAPEKSKLAHKPNVDLLHHLNTASKIVEKRMNGQSTKNSKTVIHLNKRARQRYMK